MTGLAKSCAICRTRKVKCDRKDGGCSQCVKYKWDCPGYPTVKAKRSRSKRCSTYNEAFQNKSIHLKVQRQQATATSPSSHAHLGFLGSPIALQLVSLLAPTCIPGQSLGHLGFLTLVPPRLGSNDALDDAVRCLCAGYPAMMSGRLSKYDKDYAQALKSLRGSLEDRDTALSTDTLCAIICLSWYEVLIDPLSTHWLAHTTGLIQLIQLRGPDKHTDCFSRALLHTEHGLIATQALMEKKPCFLNESRWASLLGAPFPEPSNFTNVPKFEDHFGHLDALSCIRRDVEDLQTVSADAFHSTAMNIMGKLQDLRQTLSGALFPPHDTPSTLDDDIDARSASHPDSLILCKSALTHIMIDLAILDLSQLSRSHHHESVSWIADFIPDLVPLFDDSQLQSISDERSLEGEIGCLFEYARVHYRRAKIASPLSFRRMTSTYRAVYLGLEGRGTSVHPVWHRIDALMRGEM